MGYFEITALTGAIFNAALAVMVMRGKVRWSCTWLISGGASA